MLFCKTLTFVMSEKVRDVSESFKIFDKYRVERHVFHPKCLTHAEFRLEIAEAICPQQCLPLPDVHVHIDVGSHMHWRIETRRIILAALIGIDDAGEVVVHGVALVDHIFVVCKELRINFFEK